MTDEMNRTVNQIKINSVINLVYHWHKVGKELELQTPLKVK